jgi:hypothetical protein
MVVFPNADEYVCRIVDEQDRVLASRRYSFVEESA